MVYERTTIGKFILDNTYDIFNPIQRGYSWINDENGYGRLIKDIERSIKENKDKNIGTIFLYSGDYSGTKPQSNNRLSIIDGQQRVITIMMMISSISKRFRELGEEKTLNFCAKYLYDIKYDVISCEEYHVQKLELQSNFNIMFSLFIKNDMEVKFDIKSNLTNKRLYYAWKFMNEYIYKQNLDQLRILLRFLTEKLTINSYITDNYEEAIDIYIRENNRGTVHSNDDIIRTHFITKYNSIEDQIKISDKYDSILVRNLESNKSEESIVTTFIRHYYMSFNIKKSKIEIKNFIESKIDNLTENGTTEYLNELIEYSKIYKNFLEGKDGDGHKNESINIILNELKYTQPIIILLAAYDRFKNDREKFNKIVHELEILSVTYAITDTSKHDLDSSFPSIADFIRKSSTDNDFKQIIDKLKSLWEPEQQNAMSKLRNENISIKIREYILDNISKSIGSIIPKDAFTLEHIMPKHIYDYEKDDNGKKRENDNGDFIKIKKIEWHHISDEDHEKYLWDIGNLSIMDGRVNSSMKNESFIEKQKKYINCDSSYLTKSLATKLKTGTKNTSYDKAINIFNYDPPIKWDVEEILRRKECMINLFEYILYKNIN